MEGSKLVSDTEVGCETSRRLVPPGSRGGEEGGRGVGIPV